MIRRRLSAISMLLACLWFLSSCGGSAGGDGAASSIVNPISGPLTSITEPVVFATHRAGICSDCENGTWLANISNDYRFEIDPVAGTVTMIDHGWETTFDLDFLADDKAFASAIKGSSYLYDTLTVMLPGTNSGFYWSSYGVFAQPSGICIFYCSYWFDGDAFSFGVVTATGDMPVAGTADYAGVMSGFYSLGADQAQSLNGSVALTADFGAHQLTGSIYNIGSSPILGSTYAIGDISMSANISGNSFAGTVTGSASAGGLAGEVSGSFYGPQAVEVGGVFEMTGAGSMIGAFAAKQ